MLEQRKRRVLALASEARKEGNRGRSSDGLGGRGGGGGGGGEVVVGVEGAVHGAAAGLEAGLAGHLDGDPAQHHRRDRYHGRHHRPHRISLPSAGKVSDLDGG